MSTPDSDYLTARRNTLHDLLDGRARYKVDSLLDRPTRTVDAYRPPPVTLPTCVDRILPDWRPAAAEA